MAGEAELAEETRPSGVAGAKLVSSIDDVPLRTKESISLCKTTTCADYFWPGSGFVAHVYQVYGSASSPWLKLCPSVSNSIS